MEPVATWTPEYFVENEAACLKQLEADRDDAVWRSIPLLNCMAPQHLVDGQLVRFRGMVQDMQDPECYLKRYSVRCKSSESIVRHQNGQYRDILVYNAATERVDNRNGGEDTSFGERRSMFVVTIPGQNGWAIEHEKQENSATAGAVPVQRGVTEEGHDADAAPVPSRVKRGHDDDEEMDTDAATDVREKETKKPATESKPAAETQPGAAGLSADYLLNSPISDRPGKACLVKLYRDIENWTLNTVIEAVGFLSVHPALDGAGDVADMEAFEDEMSEHQATHPPPSLIPRLHAISVRKLTHTNPLLLDSRTPSSTGSADEETDSAGTALIVKELHNLLTQCLFGDRVAADYLLCHLVSSVYLRYEVESRGQFCLNLSNIPAKVLPVYTESLYQLLEMLLPASHYFPMTLENMNTVQFAPRKDYTTNKLTSGLLQLAPHTHLVLDETRLQPGKLESAGVEAVRHVAHLINDQQLKYDFKFYQLEFNADVPVLVLSEGRSMLPSNCQLPIMPDLDAIELIEETIKAGRHYIAPKLDEVRRFLTTARIRSFDMKTLDPKIVEEDFVEMRVGSSGEVSMNDLHTLFVLARLVGLSSGHPSLSCDHWERAKQLELERRNRLQMFAKPTVEP
ncbi:mini-chromosome maintenance complex-binding protein [Anopheles aquasalis]|uniref:mini-chromosome maintenance complex-binding protein n=1 Tax=Anopheles aquasalis TaxID=42839 RepID=UPI00215A7AA3|nr:mini-chromosome maintenance complex-binding protein [Anopheles aquasalis]